MRPVQELREQDNFVDSPTRPGMTARETVIGNTTELAQAIAAAMGGSGSPSTLKTQTVAFSVNAGQENTWLTVPTTGLLNIFSVDTYDSTNTFEVFTAYRISSSNILEILSASAQTYTLRIIGA